MSLSDDTSPNLQHADYPKNNLKSLVVLNFVSFLVFSYAQIGYAETTLDHLPASLSMSINTSPTPSSGTPEYVVIQPSDIATFSSETAASIAELNVREGSQFKKGDVLVKLDCRLQQAELEKAQAQSKTATLAEESAIKLKSYGSISELELVKAHSDAAIAKAEVDKFNAIVEKCIIKAPFSGSVAEIMVHPLETVKPGDPLLKIMNTENLEFEIQIPSNWLKWLKIGSLFYVHINETNKNVAVNVIRIDPQIESISQTIKITGSIPHPDASLLPGMSGQAIFPDNPDQKNKPAGQNHAK
ncbi:MAG: efflux RND transporter periplasmic adaptor subunit [Gammaproteobacteria bacterium]|nr:efflux RND transporter periplasmic adaptor subunit [Gammaproteobacteria bacterium]